MEEFDVVITNTAQKDLDDHDLETKLRILKAIKYLKTSPFPRGNTIKKFTGTRIPLYRLRVGDFRVVYHIDGKKVAIFLVVDRKDLEKKLRSML